MSTFEEDAGAYLSTVDHDKSDDWVAGFIAAIVWARDHDAKVRAEAIRELRNDDRFLARGSRHETGDYQCGVDDAADELFALMEDAADRIEREAGLK